MKKLFIIIISVLLFSNLNAQKNTNKLLDWYNKDVKSDKTFGVSTEKAYTKLLKGKTPQPIIVAIIDGGTDVNHEDLQSVIWTNPKEIAGNGIDDDHNGYVDDIHGWNFIGNANGDCVHWDNLELTRLFRKLDAKYANAEADKFAKDPDYKLYLEVKAKYHNKLKEAKAQYAQIQEMYTKMQASDSIVAKFLNKKEYTKEDLAAIKSDDKDVITSAAYMKKWTERGITMSEMKDYLKQVGAQVNYHYNLDFDPRNIVGDNSETNSSPYYGNNNVTGPDAFHGTFVAGNVGAIRNNGIGVNGVAGSVKLMIVRVVPDGDERDKDVANGILYAINNGAKVINMSFGKAYSPQKRFVDSVMRIAEAKDVLVVQAAGNDGQNIDEIPNYPQNRDANNMIISRTWITVGACSMKKGKDLPASFSNYGKKNVDVFAPGVELWGCEPDNKYGSASGTSMASPVAAGLAAVLRSYFPELSAIEIKDIIVKSAVKYTKEVNCPGEGLVKTTISFSELSISGGVANLYNAVKLADDIMKAKKK